VAAGKTEPHSDVVAMAVAAVMAVTMVVVVAAVGATGNRVMRDGAASLRAQLLRTFRFQFLRATAFRFRDFSTRLRRASSEVAQLPGGSAERAPASGDLSGAVVRQRNSSAAYQAVGPNRGTSVGLEIAGRLCPRRAYRFPRPAGVPS